MQESVYARRGCPSERARFVRNLTDELLVSFVKLESLGQHDHVGNCTKGVL